MDNDPSRANSVSEGRPSPGGLLSGTQSVHGYSQNRPSFQHSLSFGGTSSNNVVSGVHHNPSYLQTVTGVSNYSKSFHGPEPLHSQEVIDQSALHPQSEGTISNSQNNMEYNSLSGHTTSYGTATPDIHSFVPQSNNMGPQGYGSNFYVPPAHSSFTYENHSLAWIDNAFDPTLAAIPFHMPYEAIGNEWTENLENMVAEGLEVSSGTPSGDDESGVSQLPPPPTSHPTPAPPAAHTPHGVHFPATPRKIDDGKDDNLQQEYVGYEYWNSQRDVRGAVENMDASKTAEILLQENARKLRATAQPDCRFGNLLGNIKLTEEKRDDIKSLVDDTFAHSRLNNPSEKDLPRLPRLEIFNILLKSYFHNFHPQHPILHLPSLLPRNGVSAGLDRKKDILVYAMCCAGAFKHNARPIQEYARGMQELLRRTFNSHFERDPRNLRSLQSMQALHLAIYVGGWSGNPWASECSQSLCGLLNTMLRCGGWLDGYRGDWLEDELREVAPGEEEERWRVFVEREEKKRLIISQIMLECHLGTFTRARSSMTWSELTMPLLCELDLWRAETADEWAALWNQKLQTRLPRDDQEFFNPSMTALFRHFTRMSENINSVSEYTQRSECVRHLPVLLVGIHSFVQSIADNRSLLAWESKAMGSMISEAKAMLDYWWAAREISFDDTTDWLEFSSIEISHQERTVNDTYSILFHFTAMMLYIPLREVRLMNERNAEFIRKAATNRLWRTWKEKNGEDARAGLWHAGQLLQQARLMISHDTGPPWLAPMVAEAANVLWSYAALVYHDNQLSKGTLFNNENFLIDSQERWDHIPLSTRTRGIPSIISRTGEIISIFDPRGIVTECAEILNRGPLKKSKHARGRTILDEQFITQLDKLVKFGNVKVFATGVR